MKSSNRMCEALLGQALFSLLLLVASVPAEAADLVVAEARGIGLQIGQAIDPAKPLELKVGQHVTLITSAGVTIKLDGPYNNLPTASQNGGGNGTIVLAALMTQIRRAQAKSARRAGPRRL